jgi:starvation-inducible outer membrane lipoprotein
MAMINAISLTIALLALMAVALSGCTNPPPGCTGPVGIMNQGLWPQTQTEARK